MINIFSKLQNNSFKNNIIWKFEVEQKKIIQSFY